MCTFVNRFGQDTKNAVMFVALDVASNVFEILTFATCLLKLSPNLKSRQNNCMRTPESLA